MVSIDPTRILLVEDDPNDVELVQMAFDGHSFVNPLDVVTDGAQALEYLHGERDEPSAQPLPRLVRTLTQRA